MAVAFGACTYQSVKTNLYNESQHILMRRIQVVADTILTVYTSPKEISQAINTLFFPTATNRFVRVLRGDGSILYISDQPKDGGFDPNKISIPHDMTPLRFEHMNNGNDIIVVAKAVTAGNKHYIVEMGGYAEDIENALKELVLTLLYGLPVAIIVTSAGGYILLRRALEPVEEITAAAGTITVSNLKERLPVQQTGDAIEQLSVTLNQMLARLEDSYQQASRFSADASHELRTPLTIMRSELEALARSKTIPANYRETVAGILEEAERLSRISENLFALSRFDAGEGKVKHVRFDLAELAVNTADQMSLLAEEKQITLSIHTQYRVFSQGDPERIKQVVVNLLDNAIKYTPRSGEIGLSVKEENHKAVLEISDNGIGIAAAELSHVFERFYRTDKVRSRELGGAGLGLSIVRSIIQAHGGNVDILSRGEGKGTLCRVELPLAEASKQVA